MANLPEVAQWGEEEDGIYQFELEDFITGGPGGNDNEPHRLLANRTRFLKERQEQILLDMQRVGGLKNLWIDGAMHIWPDGHSGNIVGAGGHYQYGIMIIRGVDLVGGSATWERVVDSNRQWLKLTHQGATAEGYIGQRWERDTLQHLKGKTVTLSFDYKCGQDMKGWMVFYNEQDVIHNGIGNTMAEKQYQYIGDNQVHRAEITVTLTDDNIIPDDNAYFGIQIGYGDNIDGRGGMPDGSLYITNIQLEVNNKATDFVHRPKIVEQLLYDRFYQKSPSWVTGHRVASAARRVIVPQSFPVPMRKTPQLAITALALYNNSGALIGVTNIHGTTRTNVCSYIEANQDLLDSAYMVKYTADARIY